MPLYEYICSQCNNCFEILCKTEEKPRHPNCPHCKSDQTKMLFTGFCVQGGEKSFHSPAGCNTCRGGNCSSCH